MQKKFQQWLSGASRFLSKPRSRETVKKILITLFSATYLFVTYLLSIPFLTQELSVSPGDRANRNIITSKDFFFYDKENEKKIRLKAFAKQPHVFDRDYKVLDKLINSIDVYFGIPGKENPSIANITYEVAIKRLPFLSRYSKRHVLEFLKNNKNIMMWSRAYATRIFDNFGITRHALPRLNNFRIIGAEVRTIKAKNPRENFRLPANRIIDRKHVLKKHYEELINFEDSSDLKINAELKNIAIHLILTFFSENPYLKYNEGATEFLKKQAAQNAPIEPERIRKGTILAHVGNIIDQKTFAKVQALKREQEGFSVYFFIGMLLIQGILILGVSVFIFRFSNFRFSDLSSHVILHSLILSLTFFAFILSRIDSIQSSDLEFGLFVPLAFMSTTMALLFGPRVTLIVGIYISFFLLIISHYQSTTLFLSFISIITGIYTAEKMEKRTQFFKGALIAGLAMALICLGVDLINNKVTKITGYKIILSLLNGFVSIILTIGILPVYETLFNIATKFRLRELADFSNPLLKMLASDAPSTYTHTLMVANLSERAVEAIGGDTLLTRVGCLYHDIGKTSNPFFYAENKHLSPTHASFKKLGPLKSAQIIVAHVIDGIRIARENRLPEKIVSFIPEHHGTTTIQYFYHESLKESRTKKRKKKLPKELFQYPGPKPQMKETAVVMIADSVEAASRSVKKATRENLEQLVETIVKNKTDENQFSDCPLTLNDLEVVKATFVDVLISSFHGRPSYPKMKQTKALEGKVRDKK